MPPLFLVVVLAQSAPPAPDAEQLDRIRSAVAIKPAITIPAEPDDTGKPVFRVRVEALAFNYKPWEQPRKPGDVPNYVRPTMPLSHWEFLRMVTPEAFRASTLYPGMIGMTFDPVIFKNAFLKWRRDAAERGAREEVRREFEAYLRSRAESAK